MQINLPNLVPSNSVSPTSVGALPEFSLHQNTTKEKKPIQKPELYKTSPCIRYMERDKCKYSRHCRFAHGDGEMRSVSQNVKAGLTSETAVVAFIDRSNKAAAFTRRQQQHAEAQSSEGQPWLNPQILLNTSTNAASQSSNSPTHPITPTSPTAVRRMFRVHDPYATSTSSAPDR
eukprot:GILI01027914.1.p1 GENE.GILI01027914.1~~GILI01027914.1.p1  ORF type:complete len:175 (+),score=22.84 GILI01027914.1:107-631(+)